MSDEFRTENQSTQGGAPEAALQERAQERASERASIVEAAPAATPTSEAQSAQTSEPQDEFTDNDFPAEEALEHLVVPNDTHVSLARDFYGNPSRAREIAERHPFLQVGDRIKLPPAVPTLARLTREVARERGLHNPNGDGNHPDLGDRESAMSKQVQEEARKRHRKLLKDSRDREREREEQSKKRGENAQRWW